MKHEISGEKTPIAMVFIFIGIRNLIARFVFWLYHFSRAGFFCDKVSLVRNHRNAPLAIERLLTKGKTKITKFYILLIFVLACHWATAKKRENKIIKFYIFLIFVLTCHWANANKRGKKLNHQILHLTDLFTNLPLSDC